MTLAPFLLAAVISVSPPTFEKRWIYCSFNLNTPERLTQLESIMRRGAKVGYNGLLLADFKFSRLESMGKGYFQNIEKVKGWAKELGYEIVPTLFGIGYSEGLLGHDPSLAEGLPVKNALFVVKNGEARVEADPPVSFLGGSCDDLKKWKWVDDFAVLDQGGILFKDPKGRNARIHQEFTVHPFRQYHISARIKTQNFQGKPEIKVLYDYNNDLQGLQFSDLDVKATQDWTTHHVVFNSLGQKAVKLYAGAWGAGTGSIWWDDIHIEEVGLVNLLRRDGAPLEVRHESGRSLVEGQAFEKLQDPKSGIVPWPGSFEIWHEGPPITTKLPDGTRLRVSYYHATSIYWGQVVICPSEPKTYELLEDEAKRVSKAWGTKGYFMSHDEIRVLNWDKSCQDRKLSPGKILSDNLSRCHSLLKKANPGGDIYVWNDMFDPHHNAVAGPYYLVNGSYEKSWEGLAKDVIIGQWNFDKRDQSLKFFADRGNRQVIAGYYDGDPEANAQAWVESAAMVKGVIGIMYTTWQNKYEDLEKFAEAAWGGKQ